MREPVTLGNSSDTTRYNLTKLNIGSYKTVPCNALIEFVSGNNSNFYWWKMNTKRVTFQDGQ